MLVETLKYILGKTFEKKQVNQRQTDKQMPITNFPRDNTRSPLFDDINR